MACPKTVAALKYRDKKKVACLWILRTTVTTFAVGHLIVAYILYREQSPNKQLIAENIFFRIVAELLRFQ